MAEAEGSNQNGQDEVNPSSCSDAPLSASESPPLTSESQQVTPSTEEAVRVHLAAEIPAGVRLRVTFEALPSQAQAEGEAQQQVSHSEALLTTDQPLVLTLPLSRAAQPTESAGQAVHRTIPMARPRPWSAIPIAKWSVRLRELANAWPYSLANTLFGLSLLLYLFVRLIGLTNFPIYFFTDEAVQTVLAADLLRDNLKGADQVFLPTYFENGGQYNLSLSVYLQVIPYLLFGKSVFVTRATSVLVTLGAAACLGLILREFFQVTYWWSGVLLLSMAPAWFLHSRTAFESVLFTSLYCGFLYAYLLYRNRSPRYLYLSLVVAALAFYAYSPGQMVMLVTGVLLFLTDLRYHWENRAVALRGLGLLILLALPYLRFRWIHPEAPLEHLQRIGSYWVTSLPLNEKLARFKSEYLYGLSPGYWYIPNGRDFIRHLMKGYGHLLKATLPFAVIGLALALRRIRNPAHRVTLIALLAAPTGGALAEIGITRVLVFVIPATLLTALGVNWVLGWLERRHIPQRLLAFGVFLAFATVNVYMLRDALINAPTWYQDYGLGGVQYGARQLFAAVQEHLERNPGTKMIVSPSWANGTDVLARFFLSDPLPIQLGSIEGYLFQHLPIDENTLFVMTPEEYQTATTSGKFTDIRVEQTLPYPDGRAGFYFVRLHYVENIDQILAAEREARRRLLEDVVQIDGQSVLVKYPHLDMGEIDNAFDGDERSLIRTLEANPMVIELTFPQARTLSGLTARVGGTATRLTVTLTVAGADQLVVYSAEAGSVPEPRQMDIAFDSPFPVRQLRIEVLNVNDGEPAHVHLWDIWLR